MLNQVTMFILHLDILGFQAIAEEIENKTQIITAKKIRADFLTTIQDRLTYCQGLISDLHVHYEESDNWLILHKNLEIILYVISQVLLHNSTYRGYEQIPLELAIGKGIFDESTKFTGRDLIVEDEVIKFLKKSNLIIKFKDWYKKSSNVPLKKSYVLLEPECYKDLPSTHQAHSKKIQFDDTSEIYQIDVEYIRNLKDGISITDFTIDRSLLHEFRSWRHKVHPEQFYENPDENTPDTILFCIIPSSCRPNLVDFSAEFTKPEIKEHHSSGVTVSYFNPKSKPEIWHYLHEYDLLASYYGQGGSSCLKNTPDSIEIFKESTGSRIILFNNGLIFGKFNHTHLTLNSKQKDFDPDCSI